MSDTQVSMNNKYNLMRKIDVPDIYISIEIVYSHV